MELLYILLVLLTITRLFGELSVRLGQPALVGELVSGIVLGVLVRNYADVFPILAGLPDDEVFDALTDLAIFFLMLLAGIEMQPRDLVKASGGAFLVAIGGMLLPLAAGWGLGWYFIEDSPFKSAQSLFLATALAITAVPVSVKVLMDLKKLHTRMGRTIVSAAIFDNVLSLMLLTVLTALIKTGQLPGLWSIATLAGEALLFFLVASLFGRYLFPFGGRLLRSFRSDEIDFTALLVVALAFSLLAEGVGLHFIVGAFLAGLFFVRRTIDPPAYDAVKERLSGITTGFLAPIFFASIGMHLEIEAAEAVPGFVALLVIAAFVCKIIGAGLPALLLRFGTRDAMAVGVGMSARGAVELIIAEIALKAGLFQVPEPVPTVVHYMFSAVIIMALVTTLLTPLMLRVLLKRRATDESGEGGEASKSNAEARYR